MNHWHLQTLDLSLDVILQVVPGIVHKYQSVLSPEWTLSVKKQGQLSQEEQLHLGVCVHLSQGEVGFPFRAYSSYERYPRADGPSVHTVHNPSLPPAPTTVVLQIDPCLIDVDNTLALEEESDHCLCVQLPEDEATGGICLKGDALQWTIGKIQFLFHYFSHKLQLNF